MDLNAFQFLKDTVIFISGIDAHFCAFHRKMIDGKQFKIISEKLIKVEIPQISQIGVSRPDGRFYPDFTLLQIQRSYFDRVIVCYLNRNIPFHFNGGNFYPVKSRGTNDRVDREKSDVFSSQFFILRGIG